MPDALKLEGFFLSSFLSLLLSRQHDVSRKSQTPNLCLLFHKRTMESSSQFKIKRPGFNTTTEPPVQNKALLTKTDARRVAKLI
eukprot:scaffold10532_cov449-Chaetoceros_neogracile.AAC.13